MGCWDDLKLTLKFEILHQLPRSDIITCQSVSRSCREVAVHILYNNVTLNYSEDAFLFLKGQFQAIQPSGGLFVDSLNITACFPPGTVHELGSLIIPMFANACPNVQYLMGCPNSWQYWKGMNNIQPMKHWSSLKYLPFHADHALDYYNASLKFKDSLTNVSIKYLPKEWSKATGTELLKFIQETYPKVESLEIYQRKIKHVIELDQLTFFLPNLRHLILGRGRPKSMSQPPRDQLSKVKDRTSIVPHMHLEKLSLCLPRLDVSIDFLVTKFPAVKVLEIVFDKVSQLIVTRDRNWLNTLFEYLFTRHSYSLLIPVDSPAYLLDAFYHYYSQFFPPDSYSLVIKYSPNVATAPRRIPDQQYISNVKLSTSGPNTPGFAQIQYGYFPMDDYFLELTSEVFETVGGNLKNLDIDMSRGYADTMGTELMGGYFLDSLIFYYCKNLISLQLQHFHLVRCKPTSAIPLNHSIQQLYLGNTHLSNGEILSDISLRLPNLSHVYLDSCIWVVNSNIINVHFPYSHIEELIIADVLDTSILVKWVVVTVENGNKAYQRIDPASTTFVECEYNHFRESYIDTDNIIFIKCKSIQKASLRSKQFNILLTE